MVTREGVPGSAARSHSHSAVHKPTWKQQNLQAPPLTIFGVLVTQRFGPFALRREYAQPDGD